MKNSPDQTVRPLISLEGCVHGAIQPVREMSVAIELLTENEAGIASDDQFHPTVPRTYPEQIPGVRELVGALSNAEISPSGL